jgi:hypothetical protein
MTFSNNCRDKKLIRRRLPRGKDQSPIFFFLKLLLRYLFQTWLIKYQFGYRSIEKKQDTPQPTAISQKTPAKKYAISERKIYDAL